MRALRLLFLAAPLAALGAPPASFCDAPGWSRVFSDEFDTLNLTTWTVRNGTAPNDSSCRDAMCLADNVSVEGGVLSLTARRQQAGWAGFTTGAIESRGKAYWQAAEGRPFRLCVSGLLPGGGGAGAGLWPAFWMMPESSACWPTGGEQDILEEIDGDGCVAQALAPNSARAVGATPGSARAHTPSHVNPPARARSVAHATYHMSPNGTCGLDRSEGGSLFIPTLHTAYHEFAVERTLHSLAFVYDGVTVYNSTGGKLEVLDDAWYLILNFAVGGPWPKPVNASTVFPAVTKVDYVRVSSPA